MEQFCAGGLATRGDAGSCARRPVGRDEALAGALRAG